MSGFEPSWLALREPADLRARDAGLMRKAAEWLARADMAPVVVDLGCGAGSTLAAMRPVLRATGCNARWRLVDDDPALLDLAAKRAAEFGVDAETCRVDLSDVAAIPIDDARLVTASALFDLAAPDFVSALAGDVAKARAALYASLSYDGSTTFEPAHPLDGIVVAGFNRHQLRPKGLGDGPALGPAAARMLAKVMRAEGYEVDLAESPWRLGPEDGGLAVRHVDGMAEAVGELGVLDPAELAGWRTFRLESAGETRAMVGHLDLLALPGPVDG
ncbi:class I SAM-dependent methyltransferase [Jiella avicenniae]|uniref:Class I SAM-dependent methyltransferase n=1 Tax=Jiella avicenniae TaxID=2907202 RepID=A0A9X1P163_9HYPH|nr:class I SAM-dependent methyltransferase [Jiella avicenniae]MCE7027396.1 class I SAM-dependent methyltransferase [Jiella avicenniae]